MKLLYFAWIRQRIGQGSESLELPGDISTVGDLIAHLITRGEGYGHAFADLSLIKVAVNQDFADLETCLSDTDEVAFFPPVTGG